jgi:hypothetical protein
MQRSGEDARLLVQDAFRLVEEDYRARGIWNPRRFRTGRRENQTPYGLLGVKLHGLSFREFLKLTREESRKNCPRREIHREIVPRTNNHVERTNRNAPIKVRCKWRGNRTLVRFMVMTLDVRWREWTPGGKKRTGSSEPLRSVKAQVHVGQPSRQVARF